MSRFGFAAMVGVFLGCALFACGDKNAQPFYPTGGAGGSGLGGTGGNTTAVVSYALTIEPMMKASCTISGCHAGSSPANGYAFDTYDNLKANLTAANSAIQGDRMPIGGGAVLTAADKTDFQDWVTAGAPNN
jgi:hypothetical protein